LKRLSAGAAANRRAIEAHVAAATVVAAGLKAFAALLDHRAAGLIAARAGDAAAVLRVLALAGAAAQINLAALDAVPRAAAAAQAIGQHAAKVLQRAAGDFVFTAAMNFAAGRGFLEFDCAARQYTPVSRGR
jgi:hypothetical protein